MHGLIPPEVWVIGADDLAKYQLIFDHHNNEGYVSGPNAAALFNKSGLAKEVCQCKCIFIGPLKRY